MRHAGFRALAAMAATVLCTAVAAQSPMGAPVMHDGGIWKAAIPRNPMKGEFDSLDPLGVAAGARIKADCSLNWVDPDDGARYCFASGTSLEYFLDHPKTSIESARRGWSKLRAHSSSHTE